MNKEAQEFFSIRLGHEELAVLLGILRASTLPGLEDDMLEGLDDGQKEAVLAAIERSLRARGLIDIDEEEERIEVEPLTLALLGTCVYPQSTTSVMLMDKMGDIQVLYYHFRDELMVEHSFPGEGVYQFTTASDKDAMRERFGQFISLQQRTVAEGDPLELPVSGLDELREIIHGGGGDKAASILSEKGMDEEAVERVVAIFEGSQKSYLLARVDYGESSEDTVAEGLALLDGEGGLWAMFNDRERDGMVLVESISLDDARRRIEGFVAG